MFFGQKHVCRADRMSEAFSRINLVFSSLCKMLETRPTVSLLLFGPVTLLCGLKCGTFLFLFDERGICSAVRL